MYIAGGTYGDIGGPSAGFADAWLMRFDPGGARIWARQLGTSAVDSARGLAPDGLGGVFVARTKYGSLGGPSLGLEDAWLARYDADGKQLWIRQFGSSQVDEFAAIASDGIDGVYIAGVTASELAAPSEGGSDAWVARLSAQGDLLWMRQFGTSALDRATALTTDDQRGVIIVGTTSGSLGGPNAGQSDIWIARYTHEGDREWVRQYGSIRSDTATALAPDGAHGAFLAGFTRGSLGGPHAGGDDAWVSRFAPPCYPDCDQSTGPHVLDVFDFLCFSNRFDQGDPYACDCDVSTGPGVCDIFDFLCFGYAFNAGCP